MDQQSKTNSVFELLQFKFICDEDNFMKHSIFEIKTILNKISMTWKWISFSNNQKSFVFKETDPEAIKKFLAFKNLHILNSSIQISISSVNEINKNKRFIHQKNLICLEDDLILEYLKNQNVSSIFRIQRRDEFGNNISTGSFIIQFIDENIPETLNVDFVETKTFILENRPMRCTHCHLLGHTSKKCRSINQKLCKLCHYSYDGNPQSHECNQQCKNCHQFHNSSSKRCPKYIQQQQVIQYKEKYGVSHQEAFKRLELLKRTDDHEEIRIEEQDPLMTVNKESEDFKITLKLKQQEIDSLQSTIEQLKEDHLKKVKELITKNIKMAQQAIFEKENMKQLINQVQIRNQALDIELEHLTTFTNSKKIIKDEFKKFKRKGNM